MPFPYDLLLKGGRLVDPSRGLDDRWNVAFKGGRVAEVAPDLSPAEAHKVVDVAGKMVTPGLLAHRPHFTDNRKRTARGKSHRASLQQPMKHPLGASAAWPATRQPRAS